MFDSHSKDRDGNICQNGTAVSFKFASLNDLERYIKLIYFNEMQHKTLYFQVQFISVNYLPEQLQIIKSILKAHRKSVTQKRKYNENPELKRFKNKMSKHLSAGSSIFQIFQKDSNKDTVSSSKFVKFSKAKSFKTQIWDGPYYICTICHRTFYQRSVKKILQQNYQNYEIDYVSIVSSDNACYICLTCHKHLLRNKTPCQAVCNKLEIGDIPQVFQDLRRLEKVLISKK